MRGALPPRAALLALGALLVAASVVALLFQPSTADVRRVFDGAGLLGPVLFALAYAVLTVAFVPGLPLTLAAGALYDVAGGTLVAIAGASLGALGAFAVGRRAGRATVERAAGERLGALERRLAGKGFYALLTLRLIPVVPFNALNYAAGASPIAARDYALATVIGIAPGACAYAALGAGLDDPVSPLFIGAAAVTIALAVAARAFAGRVPA